jgi:lysophospholipase L1-like esterase
MGVLGAVLLCGCTAVEEEPAVQEPIAVALIGDSIFYGVWAPNKADETIEAYLAGMLSEEDTVLNYAVPGAALQSGADQPYINEPACRKSLQCGADYYVIMLGTNDASLYNWNKERFAAEYRTFLQIYIDLTDEDHVCAVIPPHAYEDEQTHLVNFSIMPDTLYEETAIIRSAAEEAGIQCVDLYSLTENHPEWFWDGVHPNGEGNRAIAEEIFRILFSE